MDKIFGEDCFISLVEIDSTPDYSCTKFLIKDLKTRIPKSNIVFYFPSLDSMITALYNLAHVAKYTDKVISKLCISELFRQNIRVRINYKDNYFIPCPIFDSLYTSDSCIWPNKNIKGIIPT